MEKNLHKIKTIHTLQTYISHLRDIVYYQKLFGIDNFSLPDGKDITILKRKIEQCRGCSRFEDRKERPRCGKGSIKADIFFVEDMLSPEYSLFCSNSSSSLFDKILSAVDLSINDIYISSLVKCRTKDETKPAVKEISSCRHYLLKEISIVRPKVICTLDSASARALLGTEKSVDELWGKKFLYNNIALIVSYHPSTLINEPSKKRNAWEDIKRIKSIVET